jgi:hypothetical protein
MRRKVIVGIVLIGLVALLFLVPVIYYPPPVGAYICPPTGCMFIRYGSITYWSFGVGAVVRESDGYSLATSNPAGAITTASTSYICSISGQPGGIFLRVISDSTMKPISGAEVTATNKPALCNGQQQATPIVVQSFATNSTEWVSLPSDNNAGYSLSVNYAGQVHNFTSDLRPASLTCATLLLPSGLTNVTITEFGMSCSTIMHG